MEPVRNRVPSDGLSAAQRAHAQQILACLDQLGQDAVMAFDREGRCFHFNAAIERLTGLVRGRAIGADVRALCALLGIEETLERHLSAVLSGTPALARQLPLQGAQKGVCDCSAAPLALDGMVYGGLCLFRAFTEQVKTRPQDSESKSPSPSLHQASTR